MANVLVIGNSNVDFVGISDEFLIKKQSNPGKINVFFGGVMKNVCENLARLGNKCTFITAIGSDLYGMQMKEYLNYLGINTIFPNTNLPSATNLVINDSNRKIVAGICDPRIIDEITVPFIESNKELIKTFDYIVLDSNLNEEVIAYIFNNFSNKNIVCEAISPAKVLRFQKYLDKIYLLKCNIGEAQTLMNISLSERDLVGGLLARGVKNVVVSNSSEDIYYGNDARDIGFVEVKKVTEYKSTSGCGAALLSGVIDDLIQNKSIKEAVSFGNELAALTLQAEGPTSTDIIKFKH